MLHKKSLKRVSDFALKSNVADLKDRVDKIHVDKINSIDILQGRNLVADNSYLYFDLAIKYIKTYDSLSSSAINTTYLTSWQSKGESDVKIMPPISLTYKFSPYLSTNPDGSMLAFFMEII